MTEDLGSRLERIKARRVQRPPNDRWMLVLGGTLLPLGLASVVLGWAGVTHTVYLYDQLTYLASGSLVGLALVIVGGFVYFTYWQTVQVREARVRQSQKRERQEPDPTFDFTDRPAPPSGIRPPIDRPPSNN